MVGGCEELLLHIQRRLVALFLIIFGDHLNSFKKKCGCAISSGGTGNDPGFLRTGLRFNDATPVG
ncbi:hypothetical protein J6590_077490 [Homalodisca vitripennis]|nr:hypothetical protein J6590_077490 [Homalodisca vitripennis]